MLDTARVAPPLESTKARRPYIMPLLNIHIILSASATPTLMMMTIYFTMAAAMRRERPTMMPYRQANAVTIALMTMTFDCRQAAFTVYCGACPACHDMPILYAADATAYRIAEAALSTLARPHAMYGFL